jgi:hypothetical protein
MFAFTGRNRFISMESLWTRGDTLKIQKPPATLIMPTSIHTYQKYLNPSGDPVPLKHPFSGE